MDLSELRSEPRALLAATVGLSIGYGSNVYITSTFAPHLIAGFGWSRAQFALLGVSMLLAIAGMPLVGRLADVFGARRIAAVGLVGTPMVFVLFSLCWGPFWYFFTVSLLQVALVGTTTTSTVYSRIIAARFRNARGLALSIAALSPPATVALLLPLLSTFVDRFGWRAGYLALAVVSAPCGLAVFALCPRDEEIRKGPGPVATRAAYASVLGDASFRIIAFGMMLCSLTLIAFTSQLKLMLLAKGLSPADATAMLSMLAVGTMLGRSASGLALDRFPARFVAAVTLGMPALGLALLGSRYAAPSAIGVAVMSAGISSGAELDVAAYLLMRRFPIALYSTAFGVLSAGMAIAAAAGSLLLSATLQRTGGFDLFLQITAALTVVGSASFLFLGARLPDGLHAREIA